MLVAGEDHVDAGDAGDEQRGVLHHVALLAIDAGVGERDDEIGALFLHHRHPGLGGLDDVAHSDLALEVGRVPDHDLRRHEADEAELDGLRLAVAVGDLSFRRS